MPSIFAWLDQLGLAAYADVFTGNDIDFSVLPELTDQDLKELGIASLGHRRRLLRAIAELNANLDAPAVMPLGQPLHQDRAERRQLTVLFCDLVGSTELATRLDPEDLRSVIGAYHRAASAVVARFNGFVAQYLGDGVLVYFGYPEARENDAEQALRCGLALAAEIPTLAPPASDALAVRIGIATGMVVVGDVTSVGAEPKIMGETPNLAARLQTLAEPNTVVMAEGTHRLVGGLFQSDDLGSVALKGFATPQRVWRVRTEQRIEGRFEALRSGATPLVGRDEEFELLVRRWQQIKTGAGRVVMIAGEPGIGKSRLVSALRHRIAREPNRRVSHFCSPHHQGSALFPIIDQLERASGFERDDGPAARLDKLEALFRLSGIAPGENTALVAELLSLPIEGRYPPLSFTLQQKKAHTLGAIVELLRGLAAQAPVLATFEDVHWIDPSSRELLDAVIDGVQNLPVLLIVTFRPEFVPPWTGRSHVTLITLSRLAARDGEAVLTSIAGDKTLPPEVRAQIISRTDGVPLFIEELTKAVLESGLLRDAGDHYALDGPLPPFAIPTTLQSSLMARLDRLAPAREVAQIGAAIGRQFTYELIRAVARLPEERLGEALDRLVEAELIFARGVPPDAEYTFKHALIQDAAYATLLRERRQELHARIASALESDRNVEPEIIARHLTEAGEAERAASSWLAAGQRAAQQSANAEAVAHFNRGLASLERVPETQDSAAAQLQLLISLGTALMTTMSSASPEIASTYARARQLAQRTDRSVELFQALWGSWMAAFSGGDLQRAAALVEELHRLAQQLSDDDLIFQAHHAGWPTLLSQGDLLGAQRSLEAGIPLYRKDVHRHHAVIYGGHDPGVCGRGLAAMTFALLGRLDRALFEANESLTLARGLAHRPSLAHAYWLANEAHYLRRDGASVRTLAADQLAFASEHGTPLAIAIAMMFEGWGLIADGSASEGLDLTRRGLDQWRRTGSKFQAPYRVARAADALLIAGEAEEAIVVLDEALEFSRQTGESWYNAEIDRLRAGAMIAASRGGGAAEAESHYLRALAEARTRHARLIEIRTARDLARLWFRQGRRDEAVGLLAPVFASFTEGFDTPDLVSAKALLDELR